MNIPKGARSLLDFIGDIEAPKGYDTIYGNNQHRLKTPVTKMTIDQIIASQRDWTKRYGSSATGRYQFMRATLTGLKKELNLKGSEKLTPAMQDRLGYHLLKRRGYADFMADRISLMTFGKKLAQEWASLPVLAATKGAHRKLERGQSYYAGDALNKSLVSPVKFEGAIDAAYIAGRRRMPKKLRPPVEIKKEPSLPRHEPPWWKRPKIFRFFKWKF